MQDTQTTQYAPPREQSASGAARPLGLGALFASLVAIAIGLGVWAGIFAGLVFAASFVYDGLDGFSDLIEAYDRFDLGRLASDDAAQRILFAGGAFIYLSALASLLTVARLIGKANAADLLGWRGPWPAISRTGWTLIALAPVYHIVAGVTLRYFYPDFAPWLIAPRDGLSLILSFLMIVILAPLVEELLFRGWIFGSLRARFSAGAAILVTTFLFAIVHWDNTGLYPLAVLAPGFVLSVIRERTGSTKAAVLGHAIYNFAGWLLLVLAGAFLLR
jgi:uncharacterized protein